MEEKGVENLCFPQQIYTFVCKTQNACPDRSHGTVACGTIPAGGWDGWVQLFDERDPNQAPQGYSRQGAGPTGYGQQGPATAPQGYAGQPYPAAGQAPYGNQGTATRADSQYSGGYTVPPADNPDDLPF